MSRLLQASRRFLRPSLLGASCGLCFAASIQRQNDTTSDCIGLRWLSQTTKDTIESKYIVGRVLGEGAFATVKSAVNRADGREYALKFCHKMRASAKALKDEIAILRLAGQHKHIVSLLEDFDMETAHVLVMEVVSGGEVFDSICEGPYTEADAANVVRQMAEALRHLHGRGIVHRDLKPENMLLVSPAQGADVKLCDFGLAGLCREGDAPLVGRKGTTAYMAPEIFKGGSYNEAVDVWSLGVIAYILLSGYHPFDPSATANDEALEAAIRAQDWHMDGAGWDSISPQAKQLICQLLQADPARRITVDDLLAAPWVAGDAAPARPLPSATADRVRAFNEARKIWRAAIRAAALVGRAPGAAAAAAKGASLRMDDLPAEVLEELQEAFAAYDADGNGSIDLAELRRVMAALGAPEGQAEEALKGADILGNGVVTFPEFCAAVGPLYVCSTAALKRAFGLFDADGSGFIEKGEVRSMLSKLGLIEADAPPSLVETLVALVDKDRDGRVSFDEFVELFSMNHPAARALSTRAPSLRS